MRENTRCEVDEPISTPTLSTTISSSSTSERPVLEKKTRPPALSSFITSTLQPQSACQILSCLAQAGHPVNAALAIETRRPRLLGHPPPRMMTANLNPPPG